MANINWPSVIKEVDNSLRTFFQPRGIKPTLRTMFYRLYSLQLIPNTSSSYKGLIKKLVDARKEGIIPFTAFSDGAKRQAIGGISRWDQINRYLDVYRSPLINEAPDPIQEAVDTLKYIQKLTQEYSYHLGRWYGQPCYVEAWIEKDALASTFLSFLKDRDIFIAVNKGYSSWTFLYDNAIRLKEQADNGKELHVLYFGDMDPSGIDMETGHLNNGLEFFDIQVDFHRVAVTLDQIEQYELPEIPDERETIAKAERDPRYKKFIDEHGHLILVELDAMLALAPDPFKEIVQASVDELFDYNIYEETKELENRNAEIKRKYLNDHIRFV